ncbi:aminotransferase class I/II-fold pyridoxal phosphate-dependent enzyme [Falsarthrobacter nasiphocae]|uniref:homocysteine desulfhydrase n=1 Tax=Falsarthrobacter nasiphocae TaxID=189863 RepID=A0AAE4C5S2_9MICC|nr:aminotransferase class I/II-fold pyridoxal phosphate-dependent enzyme [Falsarthrobacter nasiphocae]MDR6891773.1 cystathionine gamma-synthase [Falsarthrobacter nasiphocae]
MSLRPETRVVSLGRPPHEEESSLNPPIVLTSTFVGRGDARGVRTYGRDANPSWDPFEEALADLEGAEQPAVLFASGLAAVSAALSLVPQGATLVMLRHTYLGTVAVARELASRGLLTLELVEADGGAGLVERIRRPAPGGLVVWLESPTNPMLEVTDLPLVLAEARRSGVTSIVDNTFATPLGQRPLLLGADVVVHSVTKYLAGHSDVVLGAAVASTPALRERLVQQRLLGGAVAGSFEAWLALRGLRTLALRIERSQENAAELARRLEAHPAVASVRHPSLPADPGHAIAARTMDGFGSILSIQLPGGAEEADAFIASLRLWVSATSLGGVESTLERRRRHPGESPSVPPGLIRLSVGIESVDDLWEDLRRSLDTLAPASPEGPRDPA